MDKGRTYGELDAAFNWSCGYMTSETDPACLADATWHAFKVADGDIEWMAASCERHIGVLELSANYTHRLDSACGLPGSKFKWPENVCYMPDEEITAVAAAEAVPSGLIEQR